MSTLQRNSPGEAPTKDAANPGPSCWDPIQWNPHGPNVRTMTLVHRPASRVEMGSAIEIPLPSLSAGVAGSKAHPQNQGKKNNIAIRASAAAVQPRASEQSYLPKRTDLIEEQQISSGIVVKLHGRAQRQAETHQNIEVDNETEICMERTLSRRHDLVAEHVPRVVPCGRSRRRSVTEASSSPSRYLIKEIGPLEREQVCLGVEQLRGKGLKQALAYMKVEYPSLRLLPRDEEGGGFEVDIFSDITLSFLHDLIVERVPWVVRGGRAEEPMM